MKFLHTADWHLGKRLDSFSRMEEQKQVLAEIQTLADLHQVDVILVAGDLFDSFNPSNEATELLYRSMHQLTSNGKRAVVAIAGNHDSPDRIEAPDLLARECGIFFAGFPYSEMAPCTFENGLCILRTEPGFLELKIPGFEYPLRLLLTPYASEFRLKIDLGLENSEESLRQILEEQWKRLAEKYCDQQGVNILMAHLFMMKKGGPQPEEPEDEKPILHVGGAQVIFTESIPAGIQYTALGHLHRYQVVDRIPCPVVYSSSPLCYSFSEANQIKNLVVLELEPGGQATFDAVPLLSGRPLHRPRFTNADDAIAWLGENQNALVELTMSSPEYISTEDKRRILASHQGIIRLIPELVKGSEKIAEEKSGVDLTKNMEQLFSDFFKSKYGQEPNAELIDLFREIRAEENI